MYQLTLPIWNEYFRVTDWSIHKLCFNLNSVGGAGDIFSYPLGTNYANEQQFTIKWSFGENYQTLGITIKVVNFIVIPKVWEFLPKLHLIRNCF